MYYLVLDIETTGLKKDNQYPNIVQIAFQMISYENSTSRFYLVDVGSYNSVELKLSFIIKPNGYEISFENSLIHGITNKYALDNGLELKDVISRLNGYIHDYQPILIAHNAEFDIDILKYYGLYKYVSYFCTMKYLSDIKFKENDKYFKLTELYTTLFNKEIIQQHDALKDVEILYDCFKELFVLKILNENKIKEVSNRISFHDFNKLKVLKSNLDYTNKYFGFIGINKGRYSGYSQEKINYNSFFASFIKEQDQVILKSVNSSNDKILLGINGFEPPREYYDGTEQYESYDTKDNRLFLFYLLSNKISIEQANDIVKGNYIDYKILFNNSFFIGNKYKINGKVLGNFFDPSWEELYSNDVIFSGFDLTVFSDSVAFAFTIVKHKASIKRDCNWVYR